jgi:hypothetical protein
LLRSRFAPHVYRFFFRLFSRGIFRLRPLAGTVGPDAVPLVMCFWNRPSRVAEIVRMIQAQESAVPIRVILWNNRWTADRHYRRELLAAWPRDSRHSLEFLSSPVNMGGVARFFVAVKLRRTGLTGPFIMLDDDQDFDPDFVSTMLAQYSPRSIAGFWAWKLYGAYLNRIPSEPGEHADFVGTGASVCDSAIVANHDFFSGLPTRFAFIEDLWMSDYASRRGWPLRKADVDVRFVMDETNQHHTLTDRKIEFYEFLNP